MGVSWGMSWKLFVCWCIIVYVGVQPCKLSYVCGFGMLGCVVYVGIQHRELINVGVY